MPNKYDSWYDLDGYLDFFEESKLITKLVEEVKMSGVPAVTETQNPCVEVTEMEQPAEPVPSGGFRSWYNGSDSAAPTPGRPLPPKRGNVAPRKKNYASDTWGQISEDEYAELEDRIAAKYARIQEKMVAHHHTSMYGRSKAVFASPEPPKEVKPIQYEGFLNEEVKALRQMSAFHAPIQEELTTFYLHDPRTDNDGRHFIPNHYWVQTSLDKLKRSVRPGTHIWRGFFNQGQFVSADGKYYSNFGDDTFRIYVERVQ